MKIKLNKVITTKFNVSESRQSDQTKSLKVHGSIMPKNLARSLLMQSDGITYAELIPLFAATCLFGCTSKTENSSKLYGKFASTAVQFKASVNPLSNIAKLRTLCLQNLDLDIVFCGSRCDSIRDSGSIMR